ncbi:MAG: hypothetical protein ACOZQL_34510 [Myxococcota bacterium]
MVRTSLAGLLLTLTLAACGGTSQPPPDGGQPPPEDGGTVTPPPDAGQPTLATLGGPLVLDTGVQTPAELRVAVLWFPSVDSAMPARPRAAESSRVAMANPFPARWSLELFSEPPVEARAEFSTPGGGAGARSVGALVLFRDVDGDGRLTIDAEGRSRDQLFGTSAGAMPFDIDGPGLRHLIIWRTGTLGTDEAGYQQGFNLVIIDEPFVPPVVRPLDTAVTLTATADPRQALTFCDEAYVSEPDEFACGQLLYRTPRVFTLIGHSDGVRFASVQVFSGKRAVANARVRLNGVELLSDGESGFVLFELFPVVIRDGHNSVRVEAPGLEPINVEALLPPAPTFVSPDAGVDVTAGADVTVTWTGADSADSFDVSISAENGSGDYVTTAQRQATVKAPQTPGEATIRIVSMAERHLGRNLGFGSVEISRAVNVVSP